MAQLQLRIVQHATEGPFEPPIEEISVLTQVDGEVGTDEALNDIVGAFYNFLLAQDYTEEQIIAAFEV